MINPSNERLNWRVHPSKYFVAYALDRILQLALHFNGLEASVADSSGLHPAVPTPAQDDQAGYYPMVRILTP